MTSVFGARVPAPVRNFFLKFPIYTYPSANVDSERDPSKVRTSTIWIAPPPPNAPSSKLSADVECLKWQAYIALRGMKEVGVRWNISPEAAVDGRLPSLLAVGEERAELLGARQIPGWVDDELGHGVDELEGYKNEAARDESRAWVALLEGIVHAALIMSAPPQKLTLKSLLMFSPPLPTDGQSSSHPAKSDLAAVLNPPPAPLTGFSSIFPPFGTRISVSSMQSQYHDAIVSLSDRLGEDEWFLDSRQPTALDALAFAYLHCLLNGRDDVRIDVSRRENLVNWERRLRDMVESAFNVVLV